MVIERLQRWVEVGGGCWIRRFKKIGCGLDDGKISIGDMFVYVLGRVDVDT